MSTFVLAISLALRVMCRVALRAKGLLRYIQFVVQPTLL